MLPNPDQHHFLLLPVEDDLSRQCPNQSKYTSTAADQLATGETEEAERSSENLGKFFVKFEALNSKLKHTPRIKRKMTLMDP